MSQQGDISRDLLVWKESINYLERRSIREGEILVVFLRREIIGNAN